MSEFLPIDDIETDADTTSSEGDVIPKTLSDDPDIGDGSTGHEGYSIASWRLHTLQHDSLVGMTEYEGNDRISRSARRAQQASRDARTEEERQARKTRRVKVGLVLVALAALVAALGATYAMEVWGGKTVPNVGGFTQANAVQMLEEKGFSVALQAAPADTLEGRVVELSPRAGERIDEGSTVTLVIGKKRELPDVKGKTEQEARKALEEVGATNIRTETAVTLDEDEGLVHDMHPAAGSVFMSTEEIVLSITQLPRVPDVMSMSESEVRKAMKDADLPFRITYERAEASDRFRILRTEPAVGERIAAGSEINIVIGDPLIDVMRLSDYFGVPMTRIREFVESEGYGLKVAAKGQDNHVVIRFDSASDAQLSFQQKPWTREAEKASGTAEPLGEGTPVEGVRFSIGVKRQSQTSESGKSQTGKATATAKGLGLLDIDYAYIDESTARVVMDKCGFGEEILGACTQETIRLPQGSSRSGHTFYCCYGEQGDFIWTVLVAGSGEKAAEASRIVATCVPKTFFQTVDMKDKTEAIADYVAYMDEYAE